MKSLRQLRRFAALFLALCLLLGAGAPEAEALWWKKGAKQQEPQSSPSAAPTPAPTPAPEPAKDFVPYQAPPMATVAFHADKAEGSGDVKIDLSAADEGYIGVSAVSKERLKFQVRKDDLVYNYDLASDGSVSFYPLQCGNGSYLFRVMENITENKYAPIYEKEFSVKLQDEFQPFLRTSDYSRYDADSECVKKAAELAANCSTRLEVVSAVYDYVCGHIRYDKKKAATVPSGYLPDVDETLRTNKGICFDYASLAAAMLRSQGIPTKIIFGQVAPKDLYHAWNMFYTEESGWVTVSFEVSTKSWNRMDLTFSAGGADDSFVGNGTNYTDVYTY